MRYEIRPTNSDLYPYSIHDHKLNEAVAAAAGYSVALVLVLALNKEEANHDKTHAV